MKQHTCKCLFAVLLILLSSGCGSRDRDDTVARFKGGSLTVQDLEAHYRKLKTGSMFRNRKETLTPAFVFEHALNMEMIIAKGLDEKLHLDPRIRAEIHAFMSDLFLKIMQKRLVPEIDKGAFSDAELKAFYQAHRDNYTTPALLSVQMIKTADRPAALAAREALETGELDFARAAARYSADKKTAGRGGDIGTRSLKKFRPDWQPVIGSLEMERLSGPHRIGEAWYLFELTGKTPPVHHSFEEKKAYIRNDLLYTRYKKEWEKTYDRLKQEFKVKIDENRLAAFIEDRSR